MYAAAPRLDDRSLYKIARIDDGKMPIAETHRRLRICALELGLPRPSYELVRQHVHAVRHAKADLRRRRETRLAIALYTKPLAALHELDAD